MENKLTAVEWLAKQMSHPKIFNPYIEQAKEMEKEQINTAFLEGYDYCNNRDLENQDDDFEIDYYTETFNK